MVVWTVGGAFRPKARRAKRERTDRSSNLRKSRWNRGNDAVKIGLNQIKFTVRKKKNTVVFVLPSLSAVSR